MKTPIYDFVTAYAHREPLRLHMPGHKGIGDIEKYDITEISGADSLYEADGIIARSEENASALFGARTFYSAEGSSLSIRAMLYLASLYSESIGKPLRILATRNAHKTFVSACALLDAQLCWLPCRAHSYLGAGCTPGELEEILQKLDTPPTAVYLTSPDYLGQEADVFGFARVCHRYRILLLVDNAHGAYLRFLPSSRHPIDLGADMCCDSAHKTLPVLTGGAYLHLSHSAPSILADNARYALSLFGSTSPSYLILASLDRANAYLSSGYRERLGSFVARLTELRLELARIGYAFTGSEPCKLTLLAKEYGYTGYELGALLEKQGIVPEFADPDYLVLMLTPEISSELPRLLKALGGIPKKPRITDTPPALPDPVTVLSPRRALFAPTEWVDVDSSLGRLNGALTVGCPPAVPILTLGERITRGAIAALHYYGVCRIKVVIE